MNSLIVFVKNPKLGEAKTRIAADVGDKKALEIYQKLLAHTAKLVADLDLSVNIFYASEIDAEDKYFKSNNITRHLQKGNDLGERMDHAFKMILKQSDKVIIIGSDCLQLNEEIIYDAFDALDQFDYVIGPSSDGGYYLLGMKKLNSALFKNIDWSTDQVLSQTIKIINSSEAYNLLPILTDIDHIQDWEDQKHLLST